MIQKFVRRLERFKERSTANVYYTMRIALSIEVKLEFKNEILALVGHKRRAIFVALFSAEQNYFQVKIRRSMKRMRVSVTRKALCITNFCKGCFRLISSVICFAHAAGRYRKWYLISQ